ncbi:MAG: type II secretion system protein [Candidatus Vogelbacteria bacterium]|nr:type II secretion system protein [Candidatus Vogelbacteria bacterium]
MENWPNISGINMKNGFTLIEIIVSVAIFTVVMTVTMGALLTLNDSSRKAQALRTVIDNLNFSLEDMNRKVRTGDNYQCFVLPSDVIDTITQKITDCPGGGGQAVLLRTQEMFDDTHPLWIVYMFDVDAAGKGSIYLRSGTEDGGQIHLVPGKFAITAPQVDVRRAEFRVVGAESHVPKTKPMIIVNIAGVVDLAKEKLRTDFSLQTAISQRGI